MKGLKKSYKKSLAGLLAFCLTFTSLNSAAWAGEGLEFTDNTPVIQLHLDGQQLKEAAQEAIRDGFADPDSAVGAEEMALLDETGQALDSKYEKLFTENTDGSVYEFTLEFGEEDFIPGSVELRAFVRAQSAENYELTGKEQVVFLYVNHGEEAFVIATDVDGNTIPNVKVNAKASAVVEESLPGDKIEESTEETSEEVTEESDGTSEDKSVADETVVNGTDVSEEETSEVSKDATSEENADIDAEMAVDGDKAADGTEADVKSDAEAKADEDVKADVVEEPAEEAAPAADSADDSDDEQVSVSALAVPMVAESERIFSDESLTNDIDGTDEEESVTVEGKKLDGKVYREVSLSDESVAVAFVTTFDKLVLAGEETEVTGEYTLTVAHNLTVDGKLYTMSDKVVLEEESFNEDGTFDLTAYAFEVNGAALVTDGQNYVIEKSNFDSNSRFAAQLKYELVDGYKLITPEQETKGRSAGVTTYNWKNEIILAEGVSVTLTGAGSLTAKSGTSEIEVTQENAGVLTDGADNLVLTLNPEEDYGITSLLINNIEAIAGVKGYETCDIADILGGGKIAGLNSETQVTSIAVKYSEIQKSSLDWSRSKPKSANPNFLWTDVSSMDTPITAREEVWDGRFNANLDAYNNKSLTSDYATWLAPQFELDGNHNVNRPTDSNYEIRRFQTSFTLKDDESVNDKIRLFSVGNKNKIALDDDVFIFVYKADDEENINNDNFLNYLAFWGGTRVFHQEYEAKYYDFHNLSGIASTESAPLGWSLNANPDNLGKKLYELYHDEPGAGAGETFIIDVVFGEYTSGGGANAFDYEVIKSQPSSTTLTINYYQDSVADEKLLGSEIKKDVKIGGLILLNKEERNAKKSLLPYMQQNLYKDGIQIGGSYRVTGKDDVINVVYSKDAATEARVIYSVKQADGSEVFIGNYGCNSTSIYLEETITVVPGNRFDSIIDDGIIEFGKNLIGTTTAEIKDKNPAHYDNGVVIDGEKLFVQVTTETLYKNAVSVVFTAAKLYPLNYDANAGADPIEYLPESVEIAGGSPYGLSTLEPQRKNYEFLGWSTEKDDQQKLYMPGDMFDMPEEETTLYAQWKEITYNITVKHEFADGEESDATLPQSQNLTDQKVGTKETFKAGSVPGYVGILKDSEMKPGDLKTELSVEVVDQNIEVVFVYYKDTIGEGTGEETKNPDGIPDRFQIQFSYQTESETKGTVSGEIIEVKNRVNANGLFDENTAVNPDAKNIVTQARGLYEFVNWGSSNMGKSKDGSNPRDFADVEAIRKAEFVDDTVFTAYFKLPNEIEYTVEFYYESEGVYPTSAKREDISVRYTGENTLVVTVTDDDKKTSAKSGYTWDAEAPNVLEGRITGEKTVALKVYFKQQFTVTYLPGDQGTFKEQVYTVGYGESIPSFAGNTSGKDGFEFTQWNKDLTGKVTGNLVIEAQWKSSGTGTPDPGTPDPGTPDPGTPDPGTPDPGTPDLPSDNGNGGGGSTGGGGGSRPGGSGGRADEDNGPGVGQDTTTIGQEEVPLAGLPTPPTDGTTFLIDDGEVPLAALPKTGDKAMASRQLGVLLSGLLIGLYATLKKKQENSNK